MFATGIENSYPTIKGGVRVDEMEKCGHYELWRRDLRLVREIGASHLRWGPALHRTFLGPGRYDWSWVDEVLTEMVRLGIEPILDLCHFGLPDWLGDFQNQEYPEHFADYAGEFARRHPEIKLWTPINEILITTLFSAMYGWWNERLASDESYVRATLNVCRANILAMQSILQHVGDALFIQSESSEYTHPSVPRMVDKARFLNERRFLPLDLTYGHQVSAEIYRYLTANGMAESDYDFFMKQDVKFRCILGTDYYVTSEQLLAPSGRPRPSGEFFGYYVIAKQYYDRYRLPLMHTETNIQQADSAPQWLWKEWNSMLRLRDDGVPIVGFTWYSLTDQMDWDTALREDAHRVNEVGLYDLERKIRPVGVQYRKLIRAWREILPSESSALLIV